MVPNWVWVDGCELVGKVVYWVHRMVRKLVGPTNTNITPPTDHQHFSVKRCASAQEPCKVGVWVTKWQKQYPGVNNKYVCARQLINNPKENNKNQQGTSTTTPSANISCSFYDDVLYILLRIYYCTDSRSNIFPSWKRWVKLKLLRAGHRRKGSTRSERWKRNMPLGWYGHDCRRGICRGLPAVLTTLERLWPHKRSVVTKRI